jgi:hypothetical protein
MQWKVEIVYRYGASGLSMFPACVLSPAISTHRNVAPGRSAS